MQQIVVEISKYLITLFILIYTFLCFGVFRYQTEPERKGIYLRQNIFMVLIHLLSFLIFFLKYEDPKYIYAYLMQELIIILVLLMYHKFYPEANRLIVNNMCMLLTIGLIILTRLSFARARRQFIIICISLVVTFIIPFLISRVKFFEKFKWLYVGMGILSLVIVLVFSSAVNGSKLNIMIANYSFQPSEYVKILFVFSLACILYDHPDFKTIVISAIVAGVHVILLVASKDLGSAIIYFVVYFAILYCATGKIRYFILGLASGGVSAVIGYKLFSHVRVRVLAFRDPFGTIENAGYQIAQSLFAIGTGGWFGMGLGNGAPQTIPVVTSDFVFSAICEEMGVIFGMCLILICVSCFVMFMNISMRFTDIFFKLVALGLSTAYGFQVLLSIGGVTKFIPLTGVTLPLVSYGGTSVLVTLCVFGIIQGLYINKARSYINGRLIITDIDGDIDDDIEDVDVNDDIEMEIDLDPIDDLMNNSFDINEEDIKQRSIKQIDIGDIPEDELKKPANQSSNTKHASVTEEIALDRAVAAGLILAKDIDIDYSIPDIEDGSINSDSNEDYKVEHWVRKQ